MISPILVVIVEEVDFVGIKTYWAWRQVSSSGTIGFLIKWGIAFVIESNSDFETSWFSMFW